MKNTIQKLFLAGSLICSASIASASMIGVFGNYYDSNLQSNLSSLGHTVVDLGTNVNQDLSAFDSVFGTSAFETISTTEAALLTSFVNNGGGLYLTGERPCCEALNDSVETVVNSLLAGSNVQIGGQGDAGSSMTINSNVVGGLASMPNIITTWNPSASGAISGVSGDNIFASVNNMVTAAAWDMVDLVGNSGRLIVMMDVNWHVSPDANDLNILQNIETFLSAATASQSAADPVSSPSILALFALGLGVLLRRRVTTQK